MNISDLEILYEDKQIVVCVKPAGIATQSKRINEPDMVSLLKNHIRSCGKCSGEPYLAVIHRLDQPVSGILVFAKTAHAAKELNKQLQSQGFGKYYRALVSQAPSASEATLEDYLVKDGRTNTSRVCDKNTPDAKLARLHYKAIEESETKLFADVLHALKAATKIRQPSELEIHLDTGRHHQIRVQLSNLGCPIIGDTKYNPDFSSKQARTIGISGRIPLCLCAYRLEFHHPVTHKPMHFQLTP